MGTGTKRNYGIDLLRIVSMGMVLVLHMLGQGGVLGSVEVNTTNYNLAWLLEAASYGAVDCYALITGYVAGGKHRYSNIVLHWLRYFFISLVVTGVYLIFSPEIVTTRDIVAVFFPVLTKQSWFFTAYFGLFLLQPILERGLDRLNRGRLLGVDITLLLFFSIGQTLFGDVFVTGKGYSTIWLLILYILGYTFRKYEIGKQLTIQQNLCGYVLCTIITWGYKMIYEANHMDILANESWQAIFGISGSARLYNYTSPTVIGASCFLLLAFGKLSFSDRGEKAIAFLAPSAFTVYLVHTYPLIWTTLIKSCCTVYAGMNPWMMCLGMIVTSVVIYLSGIAFEYVRGCIFSLLQVTERVRRLDDCLEQVQEHNGISNTAEDYMEDYAYLLTRYRSSIMGFAALWIFVFHEWTCILPEDSVWGFIEGFIKRIGFCGVDIFFLLSGIGLIFSMEKGTIAQFYIKKARKILPPFLLVGIVCTFLRDWSAKELIKNLSGYNFFTRSIYSFLWFAIAVSLVYLFFPLYRYYFGKAPNKKVFTVMGIVIWLFLSRALSGIMRQDLYGFTNRIPVILIGVYIGCRMKNGDTMVKKTGFWMRTWCLLILGLYLSYLTTYKHFSILVPVSNCWLPNLCLALSVPFILAKGIDMLLKGSHLPSVGKGITVLFSFFGRMSYEFYCVQEFRWKVVSDLVRSRSLGNLLILVAATAVYGVWRSPFHFRAAAFRSKTAACF